jgi:Tfp pilus assembly protein PilZ
MMDRRQARRRTINHVRSGVLMIGTRRHIVKIVDLSLEGAFIATRAEANPEDEMYLELLLPRRSRTLRVPCRLVWRSESFDAATGHPAGMAIRFEALDADTRRHIEDYARSGFRLSGQEGWALAATLPSRRGLRLVLMRPV